MDSEMTSPFVPSIEKKSLIYTGYNEYNEHLLWLYSGFSMWCYMYEMVHDNRNLMIALNDKINFKYVNINDEIFLFLLHGV